MYTRIDTKNRQIVVPLRYGKKCRKCAHGVSTHTGKINHLRLPAATLKNFSRRQKMWKKSGENQCCCCRLLPPRYRVSAETPLLMEYRLSGCCRYVPKNRSTKSQRWTFWCNIHSVPWDNYANGSFILARTFYGQFLLKWVKNITNIDNM